MGNEVPPTIKYDPSSAQPTLPNEASVVPQPDQSSSHLPMPADDSFIYDPDRPSPLIKLPTDIRLKICDYALHQIVKDMATTEKVESPSHHKQTYYLGVFAFLHTNHALHIECADALFTFVWAY